MGLTSHGSSRGMIIPAGTDAENRIRPKTDQEDAAINLVGIIDLQFIYEPTDVVLDRPRSNSHADADFIVVEALGQQVEDFDFSLRHVNTTRPRLCWHGHPQEL